MPANLTKLEFRVWRQADDRQHGDPILEMKGHLTMADYHFRRNAQDGFGVDPLTITTQIRWTGEAECRITFISGAASEEALSLAWETAAGLIGLRTEQVT